MADVINMRPASHQKLISTKHDKYNSKCVCEVCTCGMHKCPRSIAARPKLESETTNKAFFRQFPIQRRAQPQVPKVVQTKYDPEVLQSSYKSQFTNLPNIKAQSTSDNLSKSNAQGYSMNSLLGDRFNPSVKAPFYGETSYNSTYLRNQVSNTIQHDLRIQVTVPVQPTYSYKPNPAKFEGSSSYKDTFKGGFGKDSSENSRTNNHLNPAGVTSALKNDGNNHSSNPLMPYQARRNIPFEAQTAYKEQYQKHDVKFVRPPELKYEYKPTKLEGGSSYKEAFQKPVLQHNGRQACPVLQMPSVPREASPGKAHITFAAERNTWE